MFRPTYFVTTELLAVIQQITVRVHELNKRRLPDVIHAQLLHDAQVSSTYASTTIEGNPLPLTDVKRLLKEKPAHIRKTEQEILNYNQALQQLTTDPIKLTEKKLLAVHRTVTQELIPDHQSGAYRREPVVIRDPRTEEIVYLPPDHSEVPRLMGVLLDWIRSDRNTLDPILLAGLFHKQFVIIHPFMDGNGRTARLATQILLAGMGLNLLPLLSFENYYNRNVSRYFRQVGVYGNFYDLAAGLDFTPWLEYFAEGILDELKQLEKRLESGQAPEFSLQPHHRIILEYIDAHGFIRDREYAQLVTRAKATRVLDFKKLMEMGLIERKGTGRSTYYVRK